MTRHEIGGLWWVAVPKAEWPVDEENPVSYTHLRAHETVLDLVCRLLLEQQNKPVLDLSDI